MKRYIYIILAGVLVLSCMKEHSSEPAVSEPSLNKYPVGSPYVTGVVTVEFSDEMVALIEAGAAEDAIATKAPGLKSMMDEWGIESMERVFPYAGEYEPRTRRDGLHRFYKVKYKADIPVTKAADDISTMPGVIMSEPVRKISRRSVSFDDPYFDQQWHYINTRYPSADIHVQEVWEKYTMGSPNVIVAVVDEPVDPTHPDLQGNLWTDSEGHTGYNFASGGWDLTIKPEGGMGDIGHGTHVAGTIAAVNNNGKYLCGIAGGDYKNGIQGVRIMSCAIWSGTDVADDDVPAGGDEVETANAIKWGADHGAVISQNSWGYSLYDIDGDGHISAAERESFQKTAISKTLKAAITYFIERAGCDNYYNQLPDSPMKGGLVFFAAGNENTNHDTICEGHEGVIAVGAYGPTGTRASYSNYGTWVDIGAPGGEGSTNTNSIWSTLPYQVGDYDYDSYGNPTNYHIVTTNWYGGVGWAGTSMACPHASGVAALLVSYFGGPGFTANQCKEYILGGATANYFATSKPIGKKLDALGAFQYAFDHGAGGAGSNTVTITVNPAIPSQIHAHETLNVNVSATSTAGVTITIELQNAPTGVSLSGGVLTISGPVSATGLHNFVIKATDTSDGTFATRNVSYTILQNHEPVSTGSLDDLLFPSKDHKVVNISSLFRDPDGETPVITAISSNSEVLKADVADGKLTLTPVGYGDAEVRVVATDFFGLSASLSFKNVVYDSTKPAQAYPQQVLNELTVRVTSEETRKTRIQVSTTSGALVFDKEQFVNIYTPVHVDMSSCAPGVYIVAVTYSGKTSSSRVVKL